MIYANNILPKDAAYYELNKASISNGIMSLESGGYATYTFTQPVLRALTEFFRISIAPVNQVDTYEPDLYVYIHTITVEGEEYCYSLTPTSDADKIYTEEIRLKPVEYKELTFTVYAYKSNSLILWEMCPEASDTNIEVEIDGVKQSLPRLLFDYNTEPIVVVEETGVIGLITFNLLGDTDLQGHLEVSYTASDDCVLTIRVNDTGVEELYTPILYDIKAGRGNIALPHSYLNRPNGYHTTYVTAQVSRGTMVIGTRGLLYTIDGGYLAERLIDAGVEVLDLTVEQTEGNIDPTNLWLIGIDASECFVKSRSYYGSENESFTPRYSLGFAKAAALEFNGTWMLDTKSEAYKHTLITDEEPYAFWVDASDNLYCQRGEDVSTRFLVDTNVSSVSACRGFNSVIYPEQDQGLVVLYVKEGIAMYRNYCYVSEGRYTWQGPFTIEIPDETVISAYVHRLNDYRLSFTITTNKNNYWYMTDRTYVTQASPVEQIEVTYKGTYPVVGIFEPDFSYDAPTYTATMNDDNDTIIIEFSYPIYAVDPISIDDFVIEHDELYITEATIPDDRHIALKLSGKNYLGVIVDYVATSCNLRFLPLPDRHVTMPLFTVVCPGYNYKETIELGYGASAKVSMRGIETINTDQQETLVVSYNSVVATVTPHAISTTTYDGTVETVDLSYADVNASVAIQQTGTSPI